MAKILLIISALVIAATAYLGFATKGKVDAIQGELSDKKRVLLATQSELTKTKTTLKKTEEELVAAKATIDERDKEIATKKGEIERLTAELAKVNEELTAKSAELEKIKATMAKPGETAVDPEQLMKDISMLKEQKALLETNLAAAKQENEVLSKQITDEKAKTVAAETQVKAYKTEYTKPGITGTVLAYNPGWNFVVINLGDRQSLKAGKEMVVTRDGQMIGKVRVTSVEPSTSIADVLPNTVAKGQTVQPGDTVVYEGRQR